MLSSGGSRPSAGLEETRSLRGGAPREDVDWRKATPARYDRVSPITNAAGLRKVRACQGLRDAFCIVGFLQLGNLQDDGIRAAPKFTP
mmetsp:Transcript_20799/g.39072  ORF Transcript_20799/g.39072 Transcript_20799/m.39072 type:complete len:88 (+) Transcript_20799:135-398(+)